MLSKKSFVAALIAGAVAFGASKSMADTITVTNGAAPTLVTSGGFAGDEQYNYIVSFSPTADVRSGDGFLIADFGAVAGFTFSAPIGAAPSGSIFSLSQPTGGGETPTGLNGETVPSVAGAGVDEFTNGSGLVLINDNQTTLDAVFTATSSFLGSGSGSSGTLDLTLYSTELGAPTTSSSVGEDHSGSLPPSSDPSSVFVPTPFVAATPLPSSSMAGGVLIALLVAYKARKARLMA
jgi:hypothetical protein